MSCLVASQFTYKATLSDGSALPIEIEFLPEEKAFRISQLLNPLSEKTVSVVLKATTEEAKLASAIKAEF